MAYNYHWTRVDKVLGAPSSRNFFSKRGYISVVLLTQSRIHVTTVKWTVALPVNPITQIMSPNSKLCKKNHLRKNNYLFSKLFQRRQSTQHWQEHHVPPCMHVTGEGPHTCIFCPGASEFLVTPLIPELSREIVRAFEIFKNGQSTIHRLLSIWMTKKFWNS